MTTTFFSDAEQASMQALYEQSMGSTVMLARATGQVDRYGKKTYGPLEAVTARIVDTSEQVYNAAGQLTVAVAKLMLPVGTGVTTDDQLFLPGQTTPAVILKVGNEPNDSWPICERVMVGRA